MADNPESSTLYTGVVAVFIGKTESSTSSTGVAAVAVAVFIDSLSSGMRKVIADSPEGPTLSTVTFSSLLNNKWNLQ